MVESVKCSFCPNNNDGTDNILIKGEVNLKVVAICDQCVNDFKKLLKENSKNLLTRQVKVLYLK